MRSQAGAWEREKRLYGTRRDGHIGWPDNAARRDSAVTLANGDRIIGRVQTVHAWLD